MSTSTAWRYAWAAGRGPGGRQACRGAATLARAGRAPEQEHEAAPRPPRFYVPSPLAGTPPGAQLRLPPEEARHATKTLRLRPGGLLELCDGRGHTVLASLAAVDRQGAVVTTAEAPVQAPRSGWQWEVACACGSLKGGRSDVLVEKCAELGAAAFLPVLTARSPTIGGGGEPGRAHSGTRPGRRRGGEESGDEDGGGGGGREGRWARVATAAMKQCLRPHAMALHPPASVAQLCERIRSADAALVGTAGAPPLAAAAAALAAMPPGHGILCIGPEGDWTPQELAALLEAGARPVGLGDLRLRAETAALALLAYVRLQLAAPEAE